MKIGVFYFIFVCLPKYFQFPGSGDLISGKLYQTVICEYIDSPFDYYSFREKQTNTLTLTHTHVQKYRTRKMSSAFTKPSNNDTSQPEDALIPELPPRITTEVQRSPPPYVTNQNLFSVLVKNKRQITSLTAGIYTHTTHMHYLCDSFALLLFSLFERSVIVLH